MMMQIARLSFSLLFLATAVSSAGDPPSIKDTRASSPEKDGLRIQHMQLSETQHGRFMAFMKQRAMISRQLQVLQELKGEKEKERDVLYNKLRNDHTAKIKSNMTNAFDIDELMRLHKADDDETGRALRVYERIRAALDSIDTMVFQKRRQWDRLYANLLEEFNITQKEDYHYEVTDRLIYRLVSP